MRRPAISDKFPIRIGGVCREFLRIGLKYDSDLKKILTQPARSYQGIAAIVAGAGQHQDVGELPVVWKQTHRAAGGGKARPFHQGAGRERGQRRLLNQADVGDRVNSGHDGEPGFGEKRDFGLQ